MREQDHDGKMRIVIPPGEDGAWLERIRRAEGALNDVVIELKRLFKTNEAAAVEISTFGSNWK